MQLFYKTSFHKTFQQPLRFLVFYAFLLVGILAMSGAPSYAQPDRTPHSKATLISEVLSVQPGTPFTVALRMELEPKWHSYWKNPGDSGLPTEISWELPEGFTAGEIEWPHPQRIPTPPMMTYGYEDEVWLLSTITPPAKLSQKDITLRAQVNWLVCQEACLPANAKLSLKLPVADSVPQTDSRWAENFQQTRAAHPTTDSAWKVSARPAQDGKNFELLLTPPATGFDTSGWKEEELYFFSDVSDVFDHAAPQKASKSGESFVLTLTPSEYAEEKPQRLSGILLAPEGSSWNEKGERALAVDVPIDETVVEPAAAAQTAANQSSGGGLPSLPLALVLALGGGVLLNLMPCVFPVLSLKVLGFVQQSGEDKTRIKKHGLAFGAGVLLSFWALAGVLLLLRAAGVGVGWGFQLQSPLFVAALVFLLFAVGLNLLGAFEVGVSLTRLSLPARSSGAASEVQSGYGGSFWSGILATIVATPCTAPFMGSALAFALTQSAATALLVFTFLGLGMAAPYVILSFNPAWLNKLPRPGAWMDTFKQLMAFPIFATALWLLAIFGLLTGVEGMAYLLAALLLFGGALWLWQRWDASTLRPAPRVLARGGALLFVLLSLGVAWSSSQQMPLEAPADSGAQQAGTVAAWQPFSTESVEEALDSGRPVFIDFTAAWCITCQVNKRVTLSQPEVMDAFAQRDVMLFRADWTRQDETISQALESYGRNGVPTYVLLTDKGSKPQVLPEVLSQSIMLSALEQIQPRLASDAIRSDISRE